MVQIHPPQPNPPGIYPSKSFQELKLRVEPYSSYSLLNRRFAVLVPSFWNSLEQIAKDRLFYGESAGSFCFIGRVCVDVRSSAQIGVPQQLLSEFEVSGLRVDDAGGRVTECVEARRARGPWDSQPVEHWIKHVVPQHVWIQRVAVRLAEDELLRRGEGQVLLLDNEA